MMETVSKFQFNMEIFYWAAIILADIIIFILTGKLSQLLYRDMTHQTTPTKRLSMVSGCIIQFCIFKDNVIV